MTAEALAGLLGASVRVGSLRVGDVAGIFVDAARSRVIGLDVLGAGDVRRFLPWVAATVDGRVVRVPSALLLVDGADSYERRGATSLRTASELEAIPLTDAEGLSNGNVTVSVAARSGINSG